MRGHRSWRGQIGGSRAATADASVRRQGWRRGRMAQRLRQRCWLLMRQPVGALLYQIGQAVPAVFEQGDRLRSQPVAGCLRKPDEQRLPARRSRRQHDLGACRIGNDPQVVASPRSRWAMHQQDEKHGDAAACAEEPTRPVSAVSARSMASRRAGAPDWSRRPSIRTQSHGTRHHWASDPVAGPTHSPWCPVNHHAYPSYPGLLDTISQQTTPRKLMVGGEVAMKVRASLLSALPRAAIRQGRQGGMLAGAPPRTVGQGVGG